MRKPWRCFISCLLLLPFGVSNANSPQQTLKTIDQKISALQNNIHLEKSRTRELENELKNSETLLGQLHQDMDDFTLSLQQKTAALDNLNAQQKKIQLSLAQQKQLLAQELVNHYILGQQDYLKLILNQESPVVLGRNLAYYRYINGARRELINEFNQAAQQLKKNEIRIQQQTQQLKTLAAKKQQKIALLNQRSQWRDNILQSLKQDINNNSQQLVSLIQNKQALLSLVERLRQQQAQHPVTPPPLSLPRLQGRIPWPTQGSLVEKYGTPIENTNLTRTGVLIAAPLGQPIYTVYPGKVVFAGWLKGYGLLMIVDHGNGYMSLYGHNQSLYRQVGAQVSAGDLLAKVGNSGGFNQSGLYFEIRYNGAPLNPESWLANHSSLA